MSLLLALTGSTSTSISLAWVEEDDGCAISVQVSGQVSLSWVEQDDSSAISVSLQTATVDPGDKPWTRTPHKGWNKTEWRKLKQKENELEETLRNVWNQLTGVEAPQEVKVQAHTIVKAKKLEPNWKTIDLERINRLIELYNIEIERRQRLLRDEEELTIILML